MTNLMTLRFHVVPIAQGFVFTLKYDELTVIIVRWACPN